MQPTSPAILIAVRGARGSVPREDGTWMWVSADNSFGTIGGGHLEFQAMANARGFLAKIAAGDHFLEDHNPSGEIVEHFALGPNLGQCCGGALDLVYCVYSTERLALLGMARSRFFLQLYGAGHVGQAIIQALAPIHCTVQWIDERSEFEKLINTANNNSIKQICGLGSARCIVERICVDAVQAEVKLAPPQAFYLVMTHSHALDLEIVEQIFKRQDFAYLGLIGSKTKRARFERQLSDRMVARSQLSRLTCPIGISGISGKEPEIIAASVVAQLLHFSKT